MKNLKRNLTTLAILAAFAMPAFSQAVTEAQLLDTLKKADAQQKDKFDACRDLQRLGTKNAVPVLAALLGDETYSHMARYALEPIPDPSVDDAFRAALGKVKGKLLVGVINSIGVRRDEKVIDAVAALLGDSDATVAYAASATLGKIGSKPAVAALQKLLATNPALAADGLLRAAQTELEAGRDSAAASIYESIAAAKVPDHMRLAAIRGVILAKADTAMMTEKIAGSDPVAVGAALRAAYEGKGSKWSKALASSLASLQPEKQIPVLQALAVRQDDVALPAVTAIAKDSKNADVRVAAIQTMTMIGNVASVTELIGLMSCQDEAVAKAAKASLSSFTAKGTDDAIAALLKNSDVALRRTAIELLGQRHAVGVIPKLVKAVTDSDETIRTASIETIGKIGGVAELSPLLSSLLIATSPKEMKSAETAIATISSRAAAISPGNVVIQKAAYGALPEGPKADVTDKVREVVKGGTLAIPASNDIFGDPADGKVKKLTIEYIANGVKGSKTVDENETLTIPAGIGSPECAEKLLASLPQSKGETKLALMRLLRSTGGTKALDAIRTATSDADPQIKETAFRALCDWPSADAMPDLLNLAKTSTDEKTKILSLRGAIRLAPLQDLDEAKKAAAIADLFAAATRPDEKRLALGSLADVADPAALALAMQHVASPDLKNEAGLAAVSVAQKIVATHEAAAVEAMKQLLKSQPNDNVAKSARQVINKAKKQ